MCLPEMKILVQCQLVCVVNRRAVREVSVRLCGRVCKYWRSFACLCGSGKRFSRL